MNEDIWDNNLYVNDMKSLMKRHKSGANCLILVTSNDVHKKNEDKEDEKKELSKEQKQDYFKCAELILSTIDAENKANVLKEQDENGCTALMWCCANGNIRTANYILEQCPDDKVKQAVIEQKDRRGYNCFHKAIAGMYHWYIYIYITYCCVYGIKQLHKVLPFTRIEHQFVQHLVYCLVMLTDIHFNDSSASTH